MKKELSGYSFNEKGIYLLLLFRKIKLLNTFAKHIHVHAINWHAFLSPFIVFIENSADPDEMHHFLFSLFGNVLE